MGKSERTPVRDTQAMITGMSPVLDEKTYCFCVVTDGLSKPDAAARALASFVEEEGLSLILTAKTAADMGFEAEMAMRRITLAVHSALDGVGLTAAVAGALAEAGIACNMVAAYHHDHAFVPADDAERALAILKELAGR